MAATSSSSMTDHRPAARRFTEGDQEAFAALSGDWNPIHLDQLAARRTVAGGVVVHGVHAALWVLETLAEGRRPEDRPAAIRAQFHKFLHLHGEASLRVSRGDGGEVVAELAVEGLSSATVTVIPGPPAEPSSRWDDLPVLALSRTPLEPSAGGFDGLNGWLPPSNGAPSAQVMFPRLCDWIGADRVQALAQLSAVVGMACPGLHSIFSGFAVHLVEAPGGRPGLGFRARVPDARYGRVSLSVGGGGIEGEATALVRPAPVAPPRMTDLCALVDPVEFAGRRALVIGGSRGLGAVTAKLLAAGGADVTVTYATGAVEAVSVIEDIVAHRAGAVAQAMACDIQQPFDADLADQARQATHLYYFATPAITRQSAGLLSTRVLAEFFKVYVERFHDLCVLAAGGTKGRALNLLYPSTVYIDTRPKGMTEYAMAKAAGEQLCRDLARAIPGLEITAPRLPRVLTDQTASPLPLKTDDAAAVMLPLLRAERPAPVQTTTATV